MSTKQRPSVNWYLLGKKASLAFNTVLTLMGVALGITSLVFILNESRPELAPREMFWGGLGSAFILVLTGILGMMCNMSVTEPAQARSAWKCYLVLASIMAALMGGGLRWAAVSTRSSLSTAAMSRLWNKLPDETALAIQSMGQCCGFANYTDRIQEPCIRYIEQVGCGRVMVQYHKRAVNRILPIVWVALSGAILAVASGMGLWWWGEREWGKGRQTIATPTNPQQSNPPFTDPLPGTPKGQSYDEWHRTVFQ